MSDSEQQNYSRDTRESCKYGIKCYQKNPAHLEKFKHPPHTKDEQGNHQAAKRMKITPEYVEFAGKMAKVLAPASDSEPEPEENPSQGESIPETIYSDEEEFNKVVENNSEVIQKLVEDADVPKDIVEPLDKKQFIRDKFLVEMPKDFFTFWQFAEELNADNPLDAFKDVGLRLVGPYDVLAGKFTKTSQISDECYLTHWRYFHDVPEFQTVLKGDDKTGFHIGYFRDDPNELPSLLASNCANRDGLFTMNGDNIFAAFNIYLEDLKKTGDPFKKLHITRFQNATKAKAQTLKLNLARKTDKIIAREKKIVCRSFNKIGLIVPYNKKSQLGYRELTMDNKALANLLNKLQKALPEQKPKLLADLQPVLTYASIAADECDFGTGIELGWNIICHGIEILDTTALGFLTSSYRLLNREAFAKIAEAHLKNRKKGCFLSVL